MRPPPRGRHRAPPVLRAWRAALAAAASLATASLIALAAVQVAPTGRLRDATAGPPSFGQHAEAVRPPTRSIGPLAIPSIGVVPTGALTPFDPGKAPEDTSMPTLVDLPQTAATRACRCEPRSLPSIAATSSTTADATTPAPRSTATTTTPPATTTVPATTTPAAVPSTTAPSTTTEDAAATTQVASSLTATATEEDPAT